MNPEDDWEAWRIRTLQQIKTLWWWLMATQIIIIFVLIMQGYWTSLFGPIIAIGSLCTSRTIIYMKEHGLL